MVQFINVMLCSHEDVNTHLPHVKDTDMQDLSSILLGATDMDIVVIWLSVFIEIGAENIYVEYATYESSCLLPIHDIHASLGRTRCLGLQFMHSFIHWM